MKIALVQINPFVGAVEHNADTVISQLAAAERAGARLAIFSEQVIIGYPARDLLLRNEVVARNVAALKRIAEKTTRIAAVVGFAEPNDAPTGRPAFNSVALLDGGRIAAIRRKRLLPTYDVFDEARYFEPAGPQTPVNLDGLRIGLTVCEDMWSDEELGGRPLYTVDPIADLAAQGVDLVVNVSASPYYLDKHLVRHNLLRRHAAAAQCPIVFVNQIGGNDELLFDGTSCIVTPDGSVAAQGPAFREDILIADLKKLSAARREALSTGPAALYDALVFGLRDYARKCGFTKAVIGLSGGIDSALVAALAAEAFGARNVHGVAMPSRFSSDHSVRDAKAVAENLCLQFSIFPIEPMHAAFEAALQHTFAGRPADVTEENIQARVRGVLLMAVSNKFGELLLTTGNKSEMAVGYCTLYGDMCGGLAVISDVPKTMVYRVARHVNERAGRELIPESTLTKPPSAELRPDQKDQDSLPPYDVLDEILDRYESRFETPEQIAAAGFDPATVARVVRLIHLSEYKRRQAPPGLKVTSRAFGFGRRMPIAAEIPK